MKSHKRNLQGSVSNREFKIGWKGDSAEEESDFTLHFPTRSTKNVANTSFSVKDTVKRFTACAWYKTEEKGTLFQYVPYNKDSMNDSFLLAVSSDGNLDIRYGEDKG